MPTKRKSKVASKKPGTGKKAKQEKPEEVSDEEEDASDDGKSSVDETDDEDRGRGKRQRRESRSFEPDDFTMASVNAAMKAATFVEGRGKKLGDIEAVKNAMKKFKPSSDEFSFAYKFVFANRGMGNKKLMKEKLLDFGGYLPPLPKGKYDKKKQDDEDEVIETKYAVKAYKMNLSQIKTLCNFFGVDATGTGGKFLYKDDMVDQLLDFLGEPHEKFTKEEEPPVAKKKAAVKSKKTPTKSRSTATSKPIEDPFSLIKDYKKGKVPSNAAMRQWVKAYIVCVDMETATTKDAILTASAKFGVDMASKKARIKQLLAEEI